MAISKGTSVGKPRVFIDLIAFAKAVGTSIGYADDNHASLFDMNPAKITSIGTNSSFNISIDINEDDYELHKLLGTVNYFAVLGHSLVTGDISDDIYSLSSLNMAYSSSTSPYTHTSYLPLGDAYSLDGYRIDLLSDNNVDLSYGYSVEHGGDGLIDVGTFSIGRYFDFPNAPDLDVQFTLSHEGIKKKRTIGGSDIVSVNYHAPPNWGDRKPWTSGENYRHSGYNGRRSWKVKFSYIDHDNVMPQGMNEDFMVDNVINDPESWITHSSENIMSHFLTLTLNGSLPFIFQPDVNLDQLAICRLDKPSTSIKQVAHKAYSISMNFVESW